MKLTLDVMPALRRARVEAVNRSFNAIAAEQLHRDQAHAAKRAEASAIVAGVASADPFGPVASDEFAAEAALRNIAVIELAQLVLSKPNEAAQRELRRQQIMARIEAAATPADLDNVGAE